jgi:membrane protein DedA with SNARE-associated domain
MDFDVNEHIEAVGYGVLFVALALENTIFVGAVVPGVTVLVAASFLAGTGNLHVALVVPIALAGILVGDNIGYAVGRLGLNRLRFVRRLVEGHEVTANRLRESSSPLLLFFQFPLPTRAALPIVAGAIRMPVKRWLLIDTMATGVYTTSLVSIGYLAGQAAGALDSSLDLVRRVQYLAAFIFICWCGLLAWKYYKRRKKPNRTAWDRDVDG